MLGGWLACAAGFPARGEGIPQWNWNSPGAPCAKYDDLRRRLLRDIGVRIDVAEPWADAFRRALSFWNMVLDANFHEEPGLEACSIRVVKGGPAILSRPVVARSQLMERAGFSGKIAVCAAAAEDLNSEEMYGIAVHEIGHLLGLRHNSNVHSVMYFLNVEGIEVLDSEDLLDLSRRYEIRPEILARGSLPIQAVVSLTSQRNANRGSAADE
jgi:hypothetical protein